MKVVFVLLVLMCCVLVIEGSGTCSYQGLTGYCIKNKKCKRDSCPGLNSQCPAKTVCCFKNRKRPPTNVCFPRPTPPPPPYIPPIMKCPTIRSSIPCPGDRCTFDSDCRSGVERCCYGCCRSRLVPVSCKDRATGIIGTCLERMYCDAPRVQGSFCPFPNQKCVCCYVPQISTKPPYIPPRLKCPVSRSNSHCPVPCRFDSDCKSGVERCCYGCCRSKLVPVSCKDHSTGIVGTCLDRMYCDAPKVQGSLCPFPNQKCVCCYIPRIPPPSRPGKCPLLQRGFRDVGGKPCTQDSQCPGEQKCCYEQCMDIETCIGDKGEGVCLHPRECKFDQFPYCEHREGCICCIKKDKKGKCPNEPKKGQSCDDDFDCPGNWKCCFGFFRGYCVPPVLTRCHVRQIPAWGLCLLPHQCHPPSFPYPNICEDKHCICCAKKPTHPGKCPPIKRGPGNECDNDDDCSKTQKCCSGWCMAPLSCEDQSTGITGICQDPDKCLPPKVRGSHCRFPHQKCVCCFTTPPPKPGKCPLLQPDHLRQQGKPCKHDFQCPREQKCCYDQCMDIETCIGTAGEGVCLLRPHCQFQQWPYCTHEENCTCCIKPNDKVGKCPPVPATFVGLRRCVLDSECVGDEKCCFGFFRGYCVPAVLKKCFVKDINAWGQCLLPHQCRPPFTKYPNICIDKHCICCAKIEKPGKCPQNKRGAGNRCKNDDNCPGNLKCCNGWCEPPVSCKDISTGFSGICEAKSQCLPPKMIGRFCPFPYQDCICCYEKPGKCPTSSNPKSSGLCTYDSDCHAEQKCCNRRCVHIERCKGPAGAGVCTHPPDCPFLQFPYCPQKECVCCIKRVKPGKCPPEPSTFHGLRRCNDDFDCENDWKCCFGFFMGYCVAPVKCRVPVTPPIWGKCLMPEHCHPPMFPYPDICEDKNCTCCAQRPPRPGKCPDQIPKVKPCKFDQQCPNPQKCCKGWCADPIRCFVPRVGAGLCMIPPDCRPPMVPYQGFCTHKQCICCVPPPTPPPPTPPPPTPPPPTPPPTSKCIVSWIDRLWSGKCMEPQKCRKKYRKCFNPNCSVPGGICCPHGKFCCFPKKRVPRNCN